MSTLNPVMWVECTGTYKEKLTALPHSIRASVVTPSRYSV